MGCLTAIFKLIFEMFYILIMGIMYIGTILFMIIKFIIKKIIEINKSNNIHSKKEYEKEKLNIENQMLTKEISNKKNITNSYSYLKIYINKKHTGLRKNNQLNYKLLGIESYDAPIVYYDDYTEVKGYNVFESDECSSEKYGNLLYQLYRLYGNDFYATIGYEEDKIKYKITIKEDKIYINSNNIQLMKNRYTYLKNKITSFCDRLIDYFTYIDDSFYYDVIPNDDLDCDSIVKLSDKLKENQEILIFEIPYMEEISTIIDIIEPKIIKEYERRQEEISNFLSKIELNIDNENIRTPSINNQTKPKKKLSWKEEDFEKEADLWGLSEEDRRIAKQERMTPAEFVEAEEYDDEELFLDEWERE